jgi:response regulator RpfG family c-di-GMP phosphodiesterase
VDNTHQFKIIHLDDHKLITDGVRDLVTSAIAECDWLSFNDAEAACIYVSNSIQNHQKIDLLVTDMIHAGMDGYTFANKVRKLEKQFGMKPMNILLLSCVDGSIPKIQNALRKKIFDGYLPIHTDEESLIQYVKGALIA